MKKMLLLLLLCCSKMYAQKNIKIDIDSFLLGMMDDSSKPRYIALESPVQSSFLAYVQPKNIATFLDTISKHYKIPKTEILQRETSFYHKDLAKHFNGYYTATISLDFGYTDPTDGKDYEVYELYLNERLFDNLDKLSFLAGFLYKCGTFQDGEVTFEDVNSGAFATAVHFISDLGFEYCEKAKFFYNVGSGAKVTFKPTEEYVVFFKQLSK